MLAIYIIIRTLSFFQVVISGFLWVMRPHTHSDTRIFYYFTTIICNNNAIFRWGAEKKRIRADSSW